MLTLYHGRLSACSQTVRLALAELELPYESRVLDLRAGEQFNPAYLELNRDAVVPTLVDNGRIVTESSIIIQYLNDVAPAPGLMPPEPFSAARARLWLLRTLELHSAVNALNFATFARTPAERRKQTNYHRMPGSSRSHWRRDLDEHGLASIFATRALESITVATKDLASALSAGPWLLGAEYTIADVGLFAYFDRLDRQGFSGFWMHCPELAGWLDRCRQRPSFQAAILDFLKPEEREPISTEDNPYWSDIQKLGY